MIEFLLVQCHSVGRWACAMAWRLIEGENSVIELTSIRERASATGLSDPLTCLMSEVNWEMKSRWRT